MFSEYICDMSSNLSIRQQLARVFSRKKRYWYAPNSSLRNAPLAKLVQFFRDVEIVGSDVNFATF